MLQWTWENRYLFNILIFVSLYIYTDVRLSDSFRAFWGNSTLFSTMPIIISIPTNNVKEFWLLHPPLTNYGMRAAVWEGCDLPWRWLFTPECNTVMPHITFQSTMNHIYDSTSKRLYSLVMLHLLCLCKYLCDVLTWQIHVHLSQHVPIVK
jgi:hypothetical protein